MNQDIYAVIGVLCTSELLHYAAWGMLAAAGLGGVALGFLGGAWLTRWRPGR